MPLLKLQYWTGGENQQSVTLKYQHTGLHDRAIRCNQGAGNPSPKQGDRSIREWVRGNSMFTWGLHNKYLNQTCSLSPDSGWQDRWWIDTKTRSYCSNICSQVIQIFFWWFCLWFRRWVSVYYTYNSDSQQDCMHSIALLNKPSEMVFQTERQWWRLGRWTRTDWFT